MTAPPPGRRSLAGLTLATVPPFTFMRSRLVMARWEGIVLLALSLGFVGRMFAAVV